MFFLFSAMVTLCVELGPLAIKKVSVVGEVIEERILWGLVRLKTDIAAVSRFKMSSKVNGLGYFRQILIEKKKGPSILVSEFDQNDLANLREALREKVIEDNSIKDVGWAELKRPFSIMLALWATVLIVGLGLWMKRLV
jgi:hypothetical protein